MKKIAYSFLIAVSLCFIQPNRAQAEIPVKARAMLTIVGYGAAGGAILGAASMAFGTSTRAVAQGASLGLYAGILFGTYVLVSHHQKRYGSYDDNSSPYGKSRDIYGDDYDSDRGGSNGGDAGGGFFDRFQKMEQKLNHKERGSNLPPLYINFLNMSF